MCCSPQGRKELDMTEPLKVARARACVCVCVCVYPHCIFTLGNSTQCSYSDLNGKESQRVDISICTADSLSYAAETNTTL